MEKFSFFPSRIVETSQYLKPLKPNEIIFFSFEDLLLEDIKKSVMMVSGVNLLQNIQQTVPSTPDTTSTIPDVDISATPPATSNQLVTPLPLDTNTTNAPQIKNNK